MSERELGCFYDEQHHRSYQVDAQGKHRHPPPGRLLAAAIVLIPRAPLGLITTAVQALAGILLPSATVFLVLLCNDRQVLGSVAASIPKASLNEASTI